MPIRPNSRPTQKTETPEARWAKEVWNDAKRRGSVETHEEQEVFHLIEAEAEKCRFEIINQSERMAECVTHRDTFSHGVRLFPPHLWDLRDGVPYFKKDGKWVRWSPSVKENKRRLDK